MWHPWKILSPSVLQRAFCVTAILAIGMVVVMLALDVPLWGLGYGIVQFEFAWDWPTVNRITTAWGPTGQQLAVIQLRLDFLFIVLYAVALSLGCATVAGRFSSRVMVAVGSPLAWLALIAGLLDAFENFSLLRLLEGYNGLVWMQVAWVFVGGKFLFAGSAAVYVLAGLFVWWRQWRAVKTM